MQTSRFDITFKNYEESPVHRDSPALARTATFFKNLNNLSICDVGCGAGHFGLKLANLAKSISFVDPSENMLSMLKDKTTPLQKNIDLSFIQSSAESLALPSDRYDMVVSRFAAHHFSDIEQSVSEMFRIIKRGGYLVINDLVGSEIEKLDSVNHTLELLHDPTHGRSYRRSDWENFISHTSGKIESVSTDLESAAGLTIDSWCSIAKAGEDNCRKIKDILYTLDGDELTELGYGNATGGMLNHIKTIYLLVKK